MRALLELLARLFGGKAGAHALSVAVPAVDDLDTIPAVVPEQALEASDMSDPDVAGELDPDQSTDFDVIDPETGLPVQEVSA